ncbi:ubiquitin-conjugating enzyme E2 J2 [Exaiptasia diaphana]|uniref:Ubiquitin-conjugating enzyme E2 J2 n=1 Tax=Exaiptasia diaphana TaxID=2652724 RepID=A0A913Y036_EXADI|nr:ubiquitin-conjugating enzyme E2 J2 [Exaiptasia diaphana]KXJ07560.1 Ubiquitin-conjugating enzyme E2 J2 [Exaiptasia diaphana]
MANPKRIHSSASARLRQDYLRIARDPVPYITACPLPSNILEWHYVVRGPENTPYEGGFYHGKLVFPKDFPFKPPRIFMITPNGRFKVNTRLCLSISDFHPDTWNPAWSVSTILTGLLSFMNETAPTLGSVETSEYQKRQFAYASGPFNLQDRIFCELFPNIVEEIQTKMKERGELTDKSKHISSSLHSENSSGGNHGIMGSTLVNLCVLLGFAAFAYTVKCVLRAVENS